MESRTAAAWAGPYEVQQAKNWTPEVAPAAEAQVWAPAVCHPLHYASVVDIFGSSCSYQPYVVPASSYSSGGQQQLVEYNSYNDYAGAAHHHDPEPMETNIDPEIMEIYINSPEKLFAERIMEFEDDAQLMKTKMHRYPPAIQALGDWCMPKVVAIGPYYHGRDHLQKAEKMKHVAAAYCIQRCDLSVQDMYQEVVTVAAKINAFSLYDKDVMAGIRYEEDFLPMMFYDACFLVIYILKESGAALVADLWDFFQANNNGIALDIMLLENQIPLEVVGEVMNMCTRKPVERMKGFIATLREYGFLLDQVVPGSTPDDWDQDYYDKAPHLLGFLRFYAVGRRSKRSTSKPKMTSSELEKLKIMGPLPFSASPIELANMGIFVTANETTALLDMGLGSKWVFMAKLSMAPLCLNDAYLKWLVNMAALELCMTPDFFDKEKAEFEDSAVCSYLLLLSMLIHREEDVHELRTKGILKGAGLNNNETLDFFTSLHSLHTGRGYAVVMAEILRHRNKWWWILPAYACVYNNWKYIVAVGSAIGGFIGVITALIGLKGAL